LPFFPTIYLIIYSLHFIKISPVKQEDLEIFKKYSEKMSLIFSASIERENVKKDKYKTKILKRHIKTSIEYLNQAVWKSDRWRLEGGVRKKKLMCSSD